MHIVRHWYILSEVLDIFNEVIGALSEIISTFKL